LLQKTLVGSRSSAAGAGDECPEPEILAAWVDGGLDKKNVALVEAHASKCARCQAVLAAVVEAAQTAPDASVPAWHETWLRGWGFRWLVPVAATAAAAVILWVVVPNDGRPDLRDQARTQLPTASPTSPQRETSTDGFKPPAAAPELSGVADESKAAKDKASNSAPSEPEQRKENAAAEGQPADRLDTPAAQARDTPATQSSDTLRAAGAAQSPPQSSVNENVALSRQAAKAAPLEITSPDPSVRWRIGGAGSVEHTTNGGASWEAVPTGSGVDLTAGASPSRVVCWLVGRAGTVLLSTDGRTWRRVPFPDMTDLMAVQAADARTATVTTADGRTFRTTDGGRSWN
jgi:hypothetical protein